LGDPRNPGSSNTNGDEITGDPDSPGPGIEGGNSSVDGGEDEHPGAGDDGEVPPPGDEALPDFAISDVNQESPRYRDTVSPRDYLGQVSAWYFGHST
jgi:hypothetical protein